MLHKACGEVTVCVVGRSEDCNELLLYGVVEAITDALNEVFKYCMAVKDERSFPIEIQWTRRSFLTGTICWL